MNAGRPERLALVAPFGLQPKGTTRYRALPLGQALAAQGHTVRLFIPPWDDPARSGQTFIASGVTLQHLRLPPRWPGVYHPWLALRLARAVMRWQPDVVYCFKPKGPSGLVGWLLWHLGRWTGRRFLFVQDADDWEGAGGWNAVAGYPGWQRWLFAWQERWGLTHADLVTVASEELAQRARALGASAVQLLPNGPPPTPHVEPAAVAAARVRWDLGTAPVALLYTRFIEFAVERLATLWAAIVTAVPEALLLVVGAGQQGEERVLQEQLAARGLGETVRLAGLLDPAAVAAALRVARVALFPYDDTLLNRAKCSVRLVELMAAGLPVVAEDVGMNRHYLGSGATGALVPPGDTTAFTAAAIALLRDPQEALRRGAQAAERIRTTFDWSIQAARLATALAPATVSPLRPARPAFDSTRNPT